MSKAWRNRCPEGHSNIESRQGRRYQCKSCDAIYAGEPLDATQHDFPVPDRADVIETPTVEEVLGELLRLEYNGRTEIRPTTSGTNHRPPRISAPFAPAGSSKSTAAPAPQRGD